MEYKNNSPIMLAYVIILFACSLLNFLDKLLVLNIADWNSVLSAAAVATYFFSLANMEKVTCSLIKKSYRLKVDKLKLLSRRVKANKLYSGTDNVKELINEIDEIEKETEDVMKRDIVKVDSEIGKSDKIVFITNTLGYIAFFAVLIINPIKKWAANMQDILTLIAFAVAAGTDYIMEVRTKQFDDEYKNIKALYEKQIKELEEKALSEI